MFASLNLRSLLLVGLTSLPLLMAVLLPRPALAQQWRSLIVPEETTPIAPVNPGTLGGFSPTRLASAQRKRVLVLDFDESALPQRRSRRLSTSATLTPGQVIGRRLVRELVADGSYTLLDASQVSQGGVVSLAQAVELGRQVGADAVVVGWLERLDLTSESTGGSFGKINLRSKQALVTVAAKAHFVSTVTGAVIKTVEAKGTAQAVQPGEFVSGVIDGNIFEGRYAALANDATQPVIQKLKQGFISVEPKVTRLAVQRGNSQRRRLVVLDLDSTRVAQEFPRASQVIGRVSQMLVSQLTAENLYVVVYSSQSSFRANVTMADAIGIGRQLEGDLVVFGEIAKVELSRAAAPGGVNAVGAGGEQVTAIAQINTQVLQTSNGELLDRVQVDGEATQVLPNTLSAQLRDRIYEDLIREAAEQAVRKTADALFEINYRP